MTFKILALQTRISGYNSLDPITKSISRQMEKVHADAVLMPEKWMNITLVENSVEYNNVMRSFAGISASHSCILIPGSFAIRREGGTLNSSPAFYNGDLLGFQDKISLFGSEKSGFTGGNDIKVFRAGNASFGVAICYDLDFPYFVKMQVRRGSRILFNPSLILKRYHSMWHLYVKLRSLENRIPIVSVNSVTEPLGGGSISTSMLQEDMAVVLKYIKAGKRASMVSEIDLDAHRMMIERRMLEDPGKYDLGAT